MLVYNRMPQRTDLYTVLNTYARKVVHSPQINMKLFIDFLEKHAKRIYAERPEWTKWTEETGSRVWIDMSRLEEGGRVVVNNDITGSWVYLSHYYVELVKEAYRNPDKDSAMPFPDEPSLNLQIPHEQIKPLDVFIDLPRFLEEGQKELLPIIKIIFPNDLGTALVPAPMIPIALMEFSILKIRDYLHRHGNKEYIQHKLSPQLAGKEDYLREILDKITIRPTESINDLKTGREISFSFWAHFCSMVKNDLNQKKELLTEEIGSIQATYIIEVCSSFFKKRAVRDKEIELAFKNFELEIEKPPYYFSREDIAKFKDTKGIPLLGYYTQDGLDAYIKKRTSEQAAPNELPDLMYFYTDDRKSWLVKKTKVLPLCAKLLTETRSVIVKTITRRWQKMLKDFIHENAMENDHEFEKLISSYVDEYAPMLKTLLKDKRLFLIHEEVQSSEKGIPESSRFFYQNELLPLSVLLMLKRRQILSDIKLLMPIWHGIPIINRIIAFFANLGRKKKKKKEEGESGYKKTADDRLNELQNSAIEAAAILIPQGKSLDSTLNELASRWGLLLNKQAKQNLVEDVNTLVRDGLRRQLRIQKNIQVNKETLDRLTNLIMDSSKGLLKISEQKILFQYIKLYLLKLLINRTVM